VRHSSGYHPDESIDVIVRTKGRSVILALSSYEPKEIILSSYHASKVVGIDSSIRITRQVFGFSYQPDARNSELAKKLEEYAGLGVETFQGNVYSQRIFCALKPDAPRIR
jgi:hypothetical protein